MLMPICFSRLSSARHLLNSALYLLRLNVLSAEWFRFDQDTAAASVGGGGGGSLPSVLVPPPPFGLCAKPSPPPSGWLDGVSYLRYCSQELRPLDIDKQKGALTLAKLRGSVAPGLLDTNHDPAGLGWSNKVPLNERGSSSLAAAVAAAADWPAV
jgi:hypothetical protein